MILNAPFNPQSPPPSQGEGRTDSADVVQSDGAGTTTLSKDAQRLNSTQPELPDTRTSLSSGSSRRIRKKAEASGVGGNIHNSPASDQDIKILSQHFKGARTAKVQAIAEALVALGQAA